MGRTLSGDSANVIALPASPTGFTAGDYVYQTRSGYGAVPSAALATGNFDVGPLATPVYASTATTSNELTYVEQLGGSMGSQVAAQLTNTNIVYAYATGNSVTYGAAATVNFRIETTAGASVVAQTSTTMTVQGPFQVSVIALPAGGFCIVATAPNASTSILNARFYNADGTTATAVLAAPSGFSESTAVSRLKLQTLSDGSVIIAFVGSTDITFRRVTTAGFDATFNTTGAYVIASVAQNLNNWDFLVDSSNNIQIAYILGSSSFIMRRLNSSGVQQTTSTVSVTGGYAAAIVRTSDGTIRGICQDSTGITTITWDGTTAALGTRIISSATMVQNGALGAFAQGASGGYVVFYNATIPSTNAIGLYFQAFSSANASLAAATRVNSAVAVNYRTQFTPIIISGNTRIYFGLFQANATSYGFTSSVVPMGIVYFAYSNTTYALVGAPTGNYNWGSQGPFALGAYARGSSTAASARFTIAATGTYPVNVTAGQTLIAKTVVDSAATSPRVSLAPLTNGEFIAVWTRNTGSYTTYISKYSATGALQVGPVVVQATGNSSSFSSTCAATFANGNILVTYSDATTTTLRFRIYTPSLTVVTSGDIDTSVNLAALWVSCASFGDGDYVAVMFNDGSNNQQVRAVRSNGTVSARLGPGLTAGATWFYPQVIGYKSNAFAIMSYDQGGGTTAARGYVVRKTGATTFLAGSETSAANPFGTAGGMQITSSPIATPGSCAYFVGSNNSNNAYRIVSVNPLFNTSTQISWSDTSGSVFSASLSSLQGGSLGYTANGTPVLVVNRGATNFVTICALTPPMDGNSNGSAISTSSGFATTLASSGSLSYVSVIPHVGEAVLIGYADSSGFLSFASIAVAPFTVNATLTAGTDVSTSALTLNPEGGYSLQGISITAAASGSSGLVQTRGTANLNANYSAATPATLFDFRNPLTFGVNGTVIGRTVIMGN